jgi:hypothetical protein
VFEGNDAVAENGFFPYSTTIPCDGVVVQHVFDGLAVRSEYDWLANDELRELVEDPLACGQFQVRGVKATLRWCTSSGSVRYGSKLAVSIRLRDVTSESECAGVAGDDK